VASASTATPVERYSRRRGGRSLRRRDAPGRRVRPAPPALEWAAPAASAVVAALTSGGWSPGKRRSVLYRSVPCTRTGIDRFNQLLPVMKAESCTDQSDHL
jgi:hypothetical protein